MIVRKLGDGLVIVLVKDGAISIDDEGGTLGTDDGDVKGAVATGDGDGDGKRFGCRAESNYDVRSRAVMDCQ